MELSEEKKAVKLLEDLGYSLLTPRTRLFLLRHKNKGERNYSYSTRKSTPSKGYEYAEIALGKLKWRIAND